MHLRSFRRASSNNLSTSHLCSNWQRQSRQLDTTCLCCSSAISTSLSLADHALKSFPCAPIAWLRRQRSWPEEARAASRTTTHVKGRHTFGLSSYSGASSFS
eukprot:12419873-Karenia_brevis.AAC.1